MYISLLKKHVQQKGRSMVEMLGVLAIIAVLSIGGIKGYSSAMHRFNLNKTIDWITEGMNNYNIYFNTQEIISNSDAAFIMEFVAPKEWQGRSPMGGKMYFGTAGSEKRKRYATSIYSLTADDCTYLVSYAATNYPLYSLWVNPLNQSFSSMNCSDENGNNCTTKTDQLKSPAKAAAACKGKLNSILLIFDYKY